MEAIGGVETMQMLLLALGAALLVGNVAVVVRERSRRRRKDTDGPRPNMRVVALNLVLGAVLSMWALSSMIVLRDGS